MNVQDAANLNIPEGSVRNIHDKDKRLLWSAVGYNVTYRGDTTQQTYSGKNLINVVETNKSVNSTGGVSSGTGTGHENYLGIDNYIPCSPSTTYAVSFEHNITDATLNIGYRDANNDFISRNNYSTNRTFTTPANAAYMFFYLYKSSGPFTTIGGWVQLELGSKVTSYEPYVGGVPSPNPDYPQDVNVVKGAQNVKITGKNLVCVNNSGSSHDITYTANEDGSVTMSGISDAISAYRITKLADYMQLKAGQTYTVSANNLVANGDVTIRLTRPNGSVFNYGVQLDEVNKTFTFVPSTDAEVAVEMRVPSGINLSSGFVVKPQVELGNQATTWELYQGQTFSVDLGSTELCKIGNYQDYIFKSSGKNLFDGILESGLINGNTGEDMPNASYIRSKDFIPVSENTTYTLSAKDYPDAYYFWYEYKSDYTYNLTQNKTSKEGTFTTNPGTAFVRFRFTTDFTDTSTPTQLEKGSMATPYEPYGTGWYVRKEIKNMTFSGIQPSSVVEVSGLQGGVVYVDSKIWGQLGAKCNKATLVRRNQGESVFDGAFYENNANFVFMGNATDTLATLRIKYANSILYYIGSSFSDILITDATLIGQLNAVHDWLRRYDYYGVVSGNLPIIINRSGII